jgi:signal peptidase II
VTDFLDFYLGTAHWPAFNLADVFVVCGVGILLIFSGREKVAASETSR